MRTLVEHATRYVLLVHLPGDRTAETVRDALAATMARLPAELKRSLTWDQGSEMGLHHQFSPAVDLPVHFAIHTRPGSAVRTRSINGLLRQHFPQGTDLSVRSAERLAEIAAGLNGRPRKTLGWDNPAERLAKLLTPAS
ncbi:IS30 family transposase [Amycolatopsis sp. NPDC004368]